MYGTKSSKFRMLYVLKNKNYSLTSCCLFPEKLNKPTRKSVLQALDCTFLKIAFSLVFSKDLMDVSFLQKCC